jgi:hypothetical protein
VNNLVSIITCTGFRPEALALCEKYILRQTYKDLIEWIIIDDSIPVGSKFGKSSADPYPSNLKLGLPFEQQANKVSEDYEAKHYFFKEEKVQNIVKKIYAGPVTWYQGINTQRTNMHEGLKHVTGNYIFIWEDDDWYHPEYIEQQIWLMAKYDAVGECNNRYYNIKERKYKYWGNIHHSSLCSSGLKPVAMKALYEAVNSGELFMDMSFWRKCREKGIKSVLFEGTNLGVGMKGLPGRIGIGAGHHSLDEQGFTADPGYDVLKSWIGVEDTQNYVKLLQGSKVK